MSVRLRVLPALALALVLPACASTPPAACAPVSAAVQLPSQRCALTDPAPVLQVPAPPEEAAARARPPAKGRPLQVAVGVPVDVDASRAGAWSDYADGRLWRLRIDAPGATHVAAQFARFAPPPGGRLHIARGDAAVPLMHYEADDANARGQLWTAQVPGATMLLEYWQPAGLPDPDLRIGAVYRGFR